MKKLLTLLFAVLLSVAVKAQNCNFTYALVDPVTVTFTAPSGFFMNGNNFTWTVSNGLCLFGANPTVVFNNPGVYTVQLEVLDSTGANVCTSVQTINMTFCDGSFVQDSQNPMGFYFNVNSPQFGATYIWSFGDGSSATGVNVTHAYSNSGPYTVSLSQTDSSGNVVYCTKNFQVYADTITACRFDISTTSPVLAGIWVNAQVASSSGTVTWDFGDGTLPVVGYTVQKVYGSNGTYNVCMRYVNGIDSCQYCQTVAITGVSNGNCNFVWLPDSGFANGVTFTDVSTGFSNYYVSWDFGDGSHSAGSNVHHVYPSSGVYVACMEVIDNLTGATLCSNCLPVTVLPNSGSCTFTSSQVNTNPMDVMFAASGTAGGTCFWDFGDGNSGNGNSVTHTYAAAGTYQVCLNIGAGGMITCTTCQWITVSGSNPYCNANFTAVSIGLQTYFIDQSVAVSLNVPPTNPPVNYNWSFGDGSSSSLQFPNHQYSAPGVYPVCLTVSTVGCSSTYCDSIVVDSVITFPVGCNAYFVFTQLTPYNMVGVNLSSGNNLSFMWDFGDGSPVSTLPYPQHQYAATGNYVICLTVTDPTGCTDTYCDSLHVDANGNIYYKAASTPFNLTILSPAQLATSINENTPVLSGIYPNPATDLIEVEWKNSESVTYDIRNVDGKQVASGELSKSNKRIDVSQFAAGVYMLRLNTSNGSFEGKSFVKIN